MMTMKHSVLVSLVVLLITLADAGQEQPESTDDLSALVDPPKEHSHPFEMDFWSSYTSRMTGHHGTSR